MEINRDDELLRALQAGDERAFRELLKRWSGVMLRLALSQVESRARRGRPAAGRVALDEFKARQRAVWDAGEYSALSPYITDVGELVVARAGITPGMRVLDVACEPAMPRGRRPGQAHG